MKMHSPCIVLAATALVAGQGGREEIEKVNNCDGGGSGGGGGHGGGGRGYGA